MASRDLKNPRSVTFVIEGDKYTSLDKKAKKLSEKGPGRVNVSDLLREAVDKSLGL